MKIDIITIFPEMFTGPFQDSIIKRAQDTQKVSIHIHDLRDWTTDVHRSVDDRPYGGGAGMLMRVDIIDKAVTDLKISSETKVILLDTKGKWFNQATAQQLSKNEHLILIAGHYEGLDHRIHEHIADEVISIGPYVLTGGELPVMVVVDSLVRLLPGVINPDSLKEESYHQSDAIEAPQYTRPAEYKGWKVPDVLLSGHHAQIETWRHDHKKNSHESK